MKAARELGAQRLRDLSRTRLGDILDASPHLRTLSPAMEQSARRHRPALLAELREPGHRERIARTLAGATRDFLHREHQFVHVDAVREQALVELYGELVDGCVRVLASPAPWPRVADDLGGALTRHHDRLRELVIELLAECGSLPRRGERLGDVVCAEYSPGLQLEVLGVRAPELEAPLLDLGCGARGALAKELRRGGLDPVLGLDRSAPAEAGFLRASWFDVSFPPEAWRTVLAHHSFSLHFLHAHIRSAEQARRFAAKYVEILSSLAAGGAFLYAPGLPFVETLLDRSAYAVSVRSVGSTGQTATRIQRLG
jgi:hypothetical protein